MDYRIEHIVIVIDESGSMNTHRTTVPLIVDNLTSHLAQRFKELGANEEVRISIFTFGSRTGYKCLIWDRDVLRMPSIKGNYDPYGNTALITATSKSIDTLLRTPQEYGDHSFLMYIVTDGYENASQYRDIQTFPAKLGGLPDNWTVGIFVPDQRGVYEAKKFGFPKDSISVWDTSKSFAEVGTVITRTTDTFLENRSKGFKGTKSLFSMKRLTVNDIKNNLTPLMYTQYNLLPTAYDVRIDQLAERFTGSPLVRGCGFYQLTKKETVQDYKQVAVQLKQGGAIYVGKQARQLLGLPDQTVDVVPDSHPEYTIYVQSTAPNRKILAGTNLLLLTPGTANLLSGPDIPETWSATAPTSVKKLFA